MSPCSISSRDSANPDPQCDRAVLIEAEGMWESLTQDRAGGQGVTRHHFGRFNNYLYPSIRGPMKLAELPKGCASMTVARRSVRKLLSERGDSQKKARRLRVADRRRNSAFPAICVVVRLIGRGLGVRPVGRPVAVRGLANQRPADSSVTYIPDVLHLQSAWVSRERWDRSCGPGPRGRSSLGDWPGDVCGQAVVRPGVQRADLLKPVGFFDVLAGRE